jgi:hypothetical protein
MYIHVNDITENVQEAKMVLFADDTDLLITIKDKFELYYKTLNVMKELEYVFKNNLITNTEKTIAMSFHSKHMRFSLRPQTTFKNIKITYQTRFLGICITENLT